MKRSILALGVLLSVVLVPTGAYGQSRAQAPHLGASSLGWEPITVSSSPSSGDVTLTSVSCAPGTQFCMALGDSIDANGNITLISEEDNQGTWKPVAFPVNSSGLIGQAEVSCVSATFCMAVGEISGILSSSPFYSIFNGSAWTPGSFTLPSSQAADQFEGISCVSQQFCVTVGFSISLSLSSVLSIAASNGLNIFSGALPLIESFNGTTWTTMTTSTLPSGSIYTSVSCLSTSFCAAVGLENNSEPLAQIYNGTSWSTSSSIYMPVTQTTSGNVTLLASVSCVSTTFCQAVGNYGNPLSTSSPESIYENFNGSTWVDGAGQGAKVGSSGALTSVACISVYSCFAASNLSNSTSSDWPNLDDFNGQLWTSQIFDITPGAVGGDITSVSCAGPSLCLAVGSYDSGAGNIYMQVEAYTEPGLAIDSTQPPGGAVGTAYLTDLQALYGTAPYSWSIISGSLPSGLSMTSAGVISGTPTTSGDYSFVVQVTDSSSPQQSASKYLSINVPDTLGPGYWMVSSQGVVFPFGSAGQFGGQSAPPYNQGELIASSPNGLGYWLATASGVIQAFGDAPSLVASQTPTSSLVAMDSTPDGKGLWIATAQGQVLTAGDAVDYSSPTELGLKLNSPIVSMAVTPDGKGYWLLGGDGGVFSFGDAKFFGSTGSIKLVAPAVAMASSQDGKGYWFVASDGGIFAYGDAKYFGSVYQINPALPPGGSNSIAPLGGPMVGIVGTSTGLGYWMSGSDGGVFAFGDASFVGSLGGTSTGAVITGFVPNSS